MAANNNSEPNSSGEAMDAATGEDEPEQDIIEVDEGHGGSVSPSASPHHSLSPSPPPFGSVAAKRIQKELAEMNNNPDPYISVAAKEDNIFEWEASIVGPEDSPYEGGIFRLSILFTPEYPFMPPEIDFRTKIFHCNINEKGRICLDILHENWSPSLTISYILLAVSSLMMECNPEDPLVPQIAELYRKDRKEHDRVARQWTKEFGM